MFHGDCVHLDEDHVVNDEPILHQIIERYKSWTATGNVHVCLWLLEATAERIWLEDVYHISSSTLVDQLEGNLVCEWPLQDAVKSPFH